MYVWLNLVLNVCFMSRNRVSWSKYIKLIQVRINIVSSNKLNTTKWVVYIS